MTQMLLKDRTELEDREAPEKTGRPRATVREFGPNWFASVMGTGIVAVAGAQLPVHLPGMRVFATVVWGLASLLLIGLTAAWAVHWIRHPAQAALPRDGQQQVERGQVGHPGGQSHKQRL